MCDKYLAADAMCVQTLKEVHVVRRTARDDSDILDHVISPEPLDLAIRCFSISLGNAWCKHVAFDWVVDVYIH